MASPEVYKKYTKRAMEKVEDVKEKAQDPTAQTPRVDAPSLDPALLPPLPPTPTGTPYPPTGTPYPPTGTPYPPTGTPYPPTGTPYPPTGTSMTTSAPSSPAPQAAKTPWSPQTPTAKPGTPAGPGIAASRTKPPTGGQQATTPPPTVTPTTTSAPSSVVSSSAPPASQKVILDLSMVPTSSDDLAAFRARGAQGFPGFYGMWQSGAKSWKNYLEWAKTVRFCEDEVSFLIAVEEYEANPAWDLLDNIVDTYLNPAIIDVVGVNAAQALKLRQSTDRSAAPPKDVFNAGYFHLMGTLEGDYNNFVAWQRSKKQ